METVDSLFWVKRGEGGYVESYAETGPTPLVSARTDNNGVAAFVEGSPRFKAPAITIERVGGTAFVQLLDFLTVPDDISVLIPKKEMDVESLYVVASIINNSKWRFSYSRKLTPSRMKKIEVPLEAFSSFKLKKLRDILPRGRNEGVGIERISIKYGEFKVGSLFDLHSGDYHKSASLPPGDTPIVSCGDSDNGISEYRSVPDDKTYAQKLTIAYNGMNTLTTKYHPYEFGTKDDVAVAFPKLPFKLSTLIFIQFTLNKERWRFSYYRKCFNEKLRNLRIKLPADKDGQIDEGTIEKVVTSTTYWSHYEQVVRAMRPKRRAAPRLTDYPPNDC